MRTRAWTAAATALGAVLLGGCGGGDGPATPPPATRPTITAFAVNCAPCFMGERAQLTPVFGGGSGRIVPDIGPVQSGVPVTTPALAGDVEYRLIVDAPGQPSASRSLTVQASHRDRYVAAGTFRSVYHSAVELPDGGVLVIGGSRGASVFSNSVDLFDPATRTFRAVGTMVTGRALARPVLLDDGRVLVVGGSTALAAGVPLELIDVPAGQVVPAGFAVRHRTGHTATRLLDGRVLIAGGIEDATAEIWDPATRTSRAVAGRMANPRESHTATLLADGRVLIVGGFTLAPAYWLAEVFDPVTEQFTALGVPRVSPMNETLGLHSAHRQADGSVLVAGGELFVPGVDAAARPTSAVLRFDPATGAFTPQTGLLAPRTLLAAVAFQDDRLVMLGGADGDGRATASGESYRPGRGALPTAPLDAGRMYHTVSRLPDGRLLILGGQDSLGAPVSSALIYE